MCTRRFLQRVSLIAVCAAGVGFALAADPEDGYEVHDARRPQPPVIVPGTSSRDDSVGSAPSDATVLFDGKDLSAWKSEKGDAQWTVADGHFAVAPGTGYLSTKQTFGDCQLHIEWSEPTDISGASQSRGNSGVLLCGVYELQVLDNYQSQTYADGMAGAVYGQYSPLVNAVKKPGAWNAYDIVFHAPVVENGKLTKPARMTAFLNGVLIQDNVELLGPIKHKTLTTYPDAPVTSGPLSLQDHGNPVRYRNVWIRELHGNPTPPNRSAKEHYKG